MDRLGIGLFLVIGTGIIMGVILGLSIWMEKNFNRFDKK